MNIRLYSPSKWQNIIIHWYSIIKKNTEHYLSVALKVQAGRIAEKTRWSDLTLQPKVESIVNMLNTEVLYQEVKDHGRVVGHLSARRQLEGWAHDLQQYDNAILETMFWHFLYHLNWIFYKKWL